MKVFLSSLVLVLPMAFPHVVAGCSDDSYTFNTVNGSEIQIQAAAYAKSEFCRVASY